MADCSAVVTLPDNTAVEVVFDDARPVNEAISAILNAGPVSSAIDKAAAGAFPMLHWRHGNDVIEAGTAARVVAAFLESGEISDAEEIISGWSDEHEYYRNLMSENFSADDDESGWGRFVADAQVALEDAGFPGADFGDAFGDAVLEALMEADDTAPLDEMKQALNIGVAFIAGKESGLGVDDLAIQPAVGSAVHSADVRADDAMANFLRFVNMPVADYREAVLREHGVDPFNLEARAEHRRRSVAEASAAWRGLEVQVDAERPPLVTPEQAVELLDNATYGGVPVCFVHLDPKAFLDLPWDQGGEGRAMVDLVGDGGKPMIGIHDYVNGSGHFVSVEGPVRLPLDYRNWRADAVGPGYGIDNVYGLYLPAFKVRPEAVEVESAPEDAVEHAPRI